MPLFFFNQAGAIYDPDVEGIELATISDARIQAVKFAGEALRDRPELTWLGDEYRVEVTDEKQLILFTFVAIAVDAPAAKAMFPKG
ncbi:hypothetical protein GCM10023264_11900 [Sphingomonas daechungensis]